MAIALKSESSRNEVRDLVIDNWKDMRSERKELEENWKRCYMAYLCKFDKKWADYAKQAGRSARYVGISRDAVETLVPQIYDAIFGADDWLKIRPVREGFDSTGEIFSEYMKYLCLHQHRHTNFERTIKMGIKSLMIVGNCPVTASWYEREVVNYEAMTDAMNEWASESAMYHQEREDLMEEYKKVVLQSTLTGQPPPAAPEFKDAPMPPMDMSVSFAGPRFSVSSIFNYVQEQHPNDEASALRINRSWRTKAYLKEMAKANKEGYKLYENIGLLHDMDNEETAKDNEAETLFKVAMGMEMPHGKDKVEIKEMHGTFEISKGGEKGIYKNYVVTVGNDNVLLRCEPSPFFSGRPLIWNARVGITEGSVYGTGPIEKGLDEQDSANAIHNQNIDAVNTVIQPEMEVLLDGLVDGVMTPSGPGARHYVNEMGAIKPVAKNYSGVPLGFQALDASLARHERITGAVNVATRSNESATRTARNSGIISTKLGGHVTDIEAEFITEALNIQLEMNAQYITDDQVINITKDKRVQDIKITPEAVRRGYVAYASGSKYLAEKQERIQNLMMAVQLAVPGPDGKPKPVKEANLYRLLFKEIMGEADNIVMSEEEYQQALAEFQQQQAQMMAMQAGDAGGQPNGQPNGQANVGG